MGKQKRKVKSAAQRLAIKRRKERTRRIRSTSKGVDELKKSSASAMVGMGVLGDLSLTLAAGDGRSITPALNRLLMGVPALREAPVTDARFFAIPALSVPESPKVREMPRVYVRYDLPKVWWELHGMRLNVSSRARHLCPNCHNVESLILSSEDGEVTIRCHLCGTWRSLNRYVGAAHQTGVAETFEWMREKELFLDPPLPEWTIHQKTVTEIQALFEKGRDRYRNMVGQGKQERSFGEWGFFDVDTKAKLLGLSETPNRHPDRHVLGRLNRHLNGRPLSIHLHSTGYNPEGSIRLSNGLFSVMASESSVKRDWRDSPIFCLTEDSAKRAEMVFAQSGPAILVINGHPEMAPIETTFLRKPRILIDDNGSIQKALAFGDIPGTTVIRTPKGRGSDLFDFLSRQCTDVGQLNRMLTSEWIDQGTSRRLLLSFCRTHDRPLLEVAEDLDFSARPLRYAGAGGGIVCRRGAYHRMVGRNVRQISNFHVTILNNQNGYILDLSVEGQRTQLKLTHAKFHGKGLYHHLLKAAIKAGLQEPWFQPSKKHLQSIIQSTSI